MAKRSRQDFEPLSEPENIGEAPAVSVIRFSASSPPPSSKFLQLDPHSPSSGEASSQTEMKCSLPPHREPLSFPSLESYEVHYNKTHLNRCLECRKNFPTEHFLNLHIEENHDALVSVRRERGEKTVSYPLPSVVILLMNQVWLFCGRLRSQVFYATEETHAPGR